MEQTVTKLWNKNFIMLAIGQVVSLFGNAIMRFALPFYLYLESGSAELFGTVVGISVIPMIIVSPLGGVLADRVNKKRLIVFLDFFVAASVFLYLLAIGSLSIVPITIIVLMLLFATNSMMSSATDSSYPLIVPPGELVRANSVTMAINTLSQLLGPVIGGVLVIEFGLRSLLIIGGICFGLAAVMEAFILIPHVKQKVEKNMFWLVATDLAKGIRYAFKTESVIGKFLILTALINLIFAGFITIGIPVITIQTLDMNERLVGTAVGMLGAGGIAGGIVSGILGKRVSIQKNHWKVFLIGIYFTLMGLALLLPVNNTFTFVIMVAMLFCSSLTMTIATVQMMAFVQRVAVPEVLGKLMGLIMTSTILAQPFGNWAYGFLLDRFFENPWIILFPAAVLIMIVALWSWSFFKSIQEEAKS